MGVKRTQQSLRGARGSGAHQGRHTAHKTASLGSRSLPALALRILTPPEISRGEPPWGGRGEGGLQGESCSPKHPVIGSRSAWFWKGTLRINTAQFVH